MIGASPARYLSRVRVFHGALSSVLPWLAASGFVGWLPRFKVLVLEGEGLVEQTGAQEAEAGLEMCLVLYSDLRGACGANGHPVAREVQELAGLVRRAGELLWTRRGERVPLADYMRMGREFFGSAFPEIRNPWFEHLGSIDRLLAEPLEQGPESGRVELIDVLLGAAAHQQDWKLLARAAARAVESSPARYVDLFLALDRTGNQAEMVRAAKAALEDPRLVGPTVREMAEGILAAASDD